MWAPPLCPDMLMCKEEGVKILLWSFKFAVVPGRAQSDSEFQTGLGCNQHTFYFPKCTVQVNVSVWAISRAKSGLFSRIWMTFALSQPKWWFVPIAWHLFSLLEHSRGFHMVTCDSQNKDNQRQCCHAFSAMLGLLTATKISSICFFWGPKQGSAGVVNAWDTSQVSRRLWHLLLWWFLYQRDDILQDKNAVLKVFCFGKNIKKSVIVD